MENEIYGSRVLVDPDPGGVGPPLLRLVVDLCCPLVVGCINRLILNFRCTLIKAAGLYRFDFFYLAINSSPYF